MSVTDQVIVGDTTSISRDIVELQHAYGIEVRHAIRAAFDKVVERARKMLISSMWSPIPKLTGLLRSQTNINLVPFADGVRLILSWPVPYAQYLIEKAGTINVRHAIDPLAFADFPKPSMDLVWGMFKTALLGELAARGIIYEEAGVPAWVQAIRSGAV